MRKEVFKFEFKHEEKRSPFIFKKIKNKNNNVYRVYQIIMFNVFDNDQLN